MTRSPGPISRRSFVKGAALAAAPYIIPASALGKGPRPAPSNRITLGMLGLGSMGLRHVTGFLAEEECQITAVCDVDAQRVTRAATVINEHYGNQDCKTFSDFRDLIACDDIDALCIAVPDHWHAIPAIMAIRAGKDVYGEKPLALTVAEGKEMVREVRRHSCVWQTGSWQRSTKHFRFACELVRNGRIGKLERVEVGIGEGMTIEPQPVMPVPEGFDYEMWLGPAPWAPYTEKRCHWNFRWILDYSGGQVTDWGAHHIDIAQWGMGTDDTGPVEVEGRGVFPEDGLWDAAVDYRFGCTYANGVKLLVGCNHHVKQGVRFIGDQGWVHVTRKGVEASKESLLKEVFGPDEIHLPRPTGDHRQGHRTDFLKCIKSRGCPITPVEVGHRSITIAHLGNIAMLTGRKIHWDPVKEDILGDDTARRMLTRAMREPWHM
jgi:predicted dehydrogenase